MKLDQPWIALASLLLIAGCRTTAPTYATSAKIRPLDGPGQYGVELTVERLEPNDVRTVLYRPSLTVLQGEPATILVQSGDRRNGMTADVLIQKGSPAGSAQLKVKVSEDYRTVSCSEVTVALEK